LLLQTGAAIGVVSLGLSGHPLHNRMVDAAMSVAWIVTLVNAVNLTDVCDGLVAGLAAVAFAAFGALGWVEWNFAAVAIGTLAGFLLFNGAPASIFLGDAGSHLLGFVMAVVGLGAFAQPGATPITAGPLLLTVGVFLFELMFLIRMRRSRGVPFWRGSPDHFTLRLQAAGLSRWATVVIAWSAAAVMDIAVVVSIASSWLFPALCLVVLLAAVCAAQQLSYMGDESVRRVKQA
jgi:UDP-GlcNAc:undecaprenyl-phosphate GlcNAc-1-phosphate transferase